MTPSRILFWLSIAFIAGVGSASLVKIPQIFIWGILVGTILLIIVSIILLSRKFNGRNIYGIELDNLLAFSGFLILFFVLGVLRFQITEFNIANDLLKKFNDRPEKITLNGRIVDGPDVRDRYQKLKIKIDGLKSFILVTAGRYPEYHYLDRLEITGFLKTPFTKEDFNYKNYLLKEGVYSVMDFPKIELVSGRQDYNILGLKGSENLFFYYGSFLYEKILLLKERLSQSIDNNFSKPQRLILAGITLGDNKNMTQDFRNKLNSAGLSHLTAISGMNVIILSGVLMSFLLFLGFWRSQAFYFSVIFVWLYVVMVGLPSSGVRAAIMGSLFLLAGKLGRQNVSSRTIVLAGAIMLLENPLLLLYDIGFQLSFLASLGIIHLRPLFDHLLEVDRLTSSGKSKLKSLLAKKLKELVGIINTTLSAQIFTLPIIVYNFGIISLVAPFTNLLILPIVSFIMSFGLLTAFLGIFSNFLGWVFALPCYLLLWYFLKVLDIFYQPWATAIVKDISFIWLLPYYFLIGFFVLFLKRKLLFFRY